MKGKEPAFTLIELMVTVVIVGITLGAGYIYMYGYLPQARLNGDSMKLVSLLKTAQSKAMTQSSRYGVIFKCDDPSDAPASCKKWFACMFADEKADGSPWVCDGCTHAESCFNCECDDSEAKGQPFVEFKGDIFLHNCSPPNTAAIDPDANSMHTIIFDRKGFSYKHLISATPPLTTMGFLADFQIFLKSQSASRVREVEVNKGGLIELVRLNKAGNISPALKANDGDCR